MHFKILTSSCDFIQNSVIYSDDFVILFEDQFNPPALGTEETYNPKPDQSNERWLKVASRGKHNISSITIQSAGICSPDSRQIYLQRDHARPSHRDI